MNNMLCSNESSFVTSLFALLQTFSFCLFYVGTSRISRSLSHIFNMALLNFILGSFLWFTVGYSIVFGKSQKGFIGSMDHALLLDLRESAQSKSGNETLCSTSYIGVSRVIFEMSFALLAPAMIQITWAEYIKPTGTLLFLTLWPLLIYYPLAHWIRADGWLSRKVDVIDYAGALTLHTTVGTSHLLFTILTKRIFINCEKLSLVDKYLQKKIENENCLFLFPGSLLTLAGWFSLNAGSIRYAGNPQHLILLNTHFTACGSAAFWLLVCFLYSGRSSLLDILYGLMAGLAGSSSFCGHVDPWSALLIGCFIGLLSHGIFIMIRHHVILCTRENSVDITFVFGIPAIIGSVAAGLFSRASIGEIPEVNGAFFSNVIQLPYQLLGIVVVICWTLFWTLLLLKFIHSTVGFWNDEEMELFSKYKELDTCELHKRNNEERLVKQRLMKAANDGNLKELQELREKFAINLGLRDFSQRTALHYTCENGDYICTEYLLKQREVDVHVQDRYRVTPLSVAVRKHREDIIILLLEHGASWSVDGVGEILCSYVASSKIDDVRKLYDLGMDLNSTDFHGRTALHIAACQGDKLMVECLLSMNIQLNKVDFFGLRALNCAEMHEHEEISELLIRHGALRIIENYSQQEICDEARRGNLRMIRHMVNNGANVTYHDINGKTALHASCKAGYLDVVKFLLNQPEVNVNARDKKNNTPLTEAIMNMQNDVAEYVQVHGGDNEEKRIMHLICKAVKKHDKRLLKQLLRWFNGSVVIDLDGQSVYHVCVRNGDVEILNTLVKSGISFREVDFFGNTPLELAIQLRCESSILRVLTELEEGKLKAQNSQVKVTSLPRRMTAGVSKSKIRRRRTRRQTRVEVASADFADNTIAEVAKSHVPESDLAKHEVAEYDEMEDDYIGELENGSLGETIPEEVTLADIELMSRKKKLKMSSARISELMTGEPQYV